MTRCNHNRVVLLGPGDRDVRAGLFVENRQGCFIAGVESVDFVAGHESVLCSLADADASAASVVV